MNESKFHLLVLFSYPRVQATERQLGKSVLHPQLSGINATINPLYLSSPPLHLHIHTHTLPLFLSFDKVGQH